MQKKFFSNLLKQKKSKMIFSQALKLLKIKESQNKKNYSKLYLKKVPIKVFRSKDCQNI